LRRGIKEETDLKIKISHPFYIGEWRPPVNHKKWQIIGIYFKCMADSAKVTLSSDLDDYKWIDPKEYKKYKLIKNLEATFTHYLKSN